MLSVLTRSLLIFHLAVLLPVTAYAECSEATIGGHPDFPPYIWAESGQVKGIAADITQRLLSELGVRLRHDSGYPYKRQLKMLERGQTDMMPLIARNPEREQYTLFVEPAYLHADAVIWRRADDTRQLNSLKDLEGLQGILRFGTTYGQRLDDYFRQQKVLREHNIDTAFNLLLHERVDYVVYDRLRSELIIEEFGWQEKFKHSDIVLHRNPLYLGISRASPCLDLAPALSQQLQRMIDNGLIREISSQHIKARSISAGENLDSPAE